MWIKPNSISFVKGAAEGNTFLNAFDNALLEAKIGNYNLIKVSSVIPAKTMVKKLPQFEEGTLIPAVYSYITSSLPGEIVSAAVGVGFSTNSYGLIYEYAHRGSSKVAEEIVKKMIGEGFKKRGLKLEKIKIISSEHKVKRIGCATAAVVLWVDKE